MPISTRSVKDFIYITAPKLINRERVEKIIETIEQTCRIVEERVALRPELGSNHVNLPTETEFPSGIVLVPQDTPLLMNLNPGAWARPSVEPIFRLAKLGWVSFGGRLRKFQQTLDYELTCDTDGCEVGIEMTSLAGVSKPEWIKKLSQTTTLLDLPVTLSGPEPTVLHRDGLSASISEYESPDKRVKSVEFKCSLSRDVYEPLMQRLVSESKGKVTAWQVGVKGEPPLPEVLAEVKLIGFPGKKTELTYWWRLQSYRCFTGMTQMAKLNNVNQVAQSLFGFEFTKGRRGQLDLAANRKGDFMPWFSFDAKADQIEFTKLTGIKLKQEI
jgi:hypothetical protein